MKLLFASDSFKGSLSSKQIINILTKAAEDVFKTCECRGVLMADGGEGTLDAVLEEIGGELIKVKVCDPLFREIEADYAILSDGTALIEMARASGLPLLSETERNPLKTTTYGTGQLIFDAIKKGCNNITISIGGSATNDGGMGAMSALGVCFYDENGNELKGVGAELEKVARIETAELERLIDGVKFTVMCDVVSPLLGEKGATFTYGAQKGATLKMQNELEEGMKNYAAVIKKEINKDVSSVPGGGAAGGLGAALMAFLGAKLKSGIETILDLMEFDELLSGVSLVVTGEGRIDSQSAQGKVVSGVGKRCLAAGVPAIAIVGGIADGYETIYQCGIESVIPTVNGIMSLDKAINEAESLYYDAAVRMFRMVRIGMNL